MNYNKILMPGSFIFLYSFTKMKIKIYKNTVFLAASHRCKIWSTFWGKWKG